MFTHPHHHHHTEGNGDYVKGTGMVNWVKCQMQWSAIKALLEFQRHPFPFTPSPQLMAYIRTLRPTMTDDQAYERSLELEPRQQGRR